MFPKVYKDGDPGRPAVSSINYHTIKISRKGLNLYIKESADLKRTINSI